MRFLRQDQLPQSGPPALCDLAVLFPRPTQPSAAGLATLAGELRTEYPSLILGEGSCRAPDAAKIVPCKHDRLDRRSRVDYLNPGDADVDKPGFLERGLHRTAPADCSPAIAHARQEAQLDGIRDMPAIGKDAVAAGTRDQLENRLAVAVLEILPPQSMAMHTEQQVALGARNDRDLLREIRPAAGSRPARVFVAVDSFSAGASGRHMSMSLAVSPRPPSQSRRAAADRVCANLLGTA